MNRKIVYGIVIVIIVAAALVLVYMNGNSGSNLNAYISTQVPQSQIAQLQTIALNNTLANKVGPGIVSPYPSPVNSVNVTLVGGKPAVIYVGGEYCPYCAITRWGLIIALMRFGNFSSLRYMASSPTDKFPNTPTYTFYNSTYASSLIAFLPAEEANRSDQPLQQLSPLQDAAALTYDPGGGIPFIDFGNKSVQVGIPPSVSPGYLAGLIWSQIITQIQDGNTTISQAVIGQANIFTAQICEINKNMPVSVCGQPYVKNIES